MATRDDIPREHEDDLQWPVPSEVLDRYELPGDQGSTANIRPAQPQEPPPRPETTAPPPPLRNRPERPTHHAVERTSRAPTGPPRSTQAPRSVRAAHAADVAPALLDDSGAGGPAWVGDLAIGRTPAGPGGVDDRLDAADVEPEQLLSAAAACAIIALAFAVAATVLPDLGPLLRGETALLARWDISTLTGGDGTASVPVAPPGDPDASVSSPPAPAPAPPGMLSRETEGPMTGGSRPAPPDTQAEPRDTQADPPDTQADAPDMPTTPPASQRFGNTSRDAPREGTPSANAAPVMAAAPPASQRPGVAANEPVDVGSGEGPEVSDAPSEAAPPVSPATPSASERPGVPSRDAVSDATDIDVPDDDSGRVASDAVRTAPDAERPAPDAENTAPDTSKASEKLEAAPPIVPGPPPDRARIEAVLGQYRAAYESLDAGAARAVWPSVDADALTRAFGNLSSQSLAFDRCDVNVNGEQAQASCSGRATYVQRVGGSDPKTVWLVWTFTLRQSNDQWTITDVDTR